MELSKVFTFAITTNEDGPLTLLFADIDKAGPFDTETMLQIVNDPEFKKIMPEGAVLINKEEEHSLLLATTDADEYMIKRLECATPEETSLLYRPGNGIEILNLQDIYYACSLPHKLIMGCKSCNAKTGTCKIKTLGLRYEDACEDCDEEIKTYTPIYIKENFKNRKTQIAGFTYISPRLTMPDLSYHSYTSHRKQQETFGKIYRTVSQHDFVHIEERSSEISQGAKERERKKRFAAKACSQCFVNTSCDHPVHCCKGPYLYNAESAAKTILEQVVIPYTPKQLCWLLANSGMLDKRYDRCLYYTTFKLKHNELKYGLSRITEHNFIPLETFKEAQAILKQYSTPVEPLYHTLPLEKQALLVEMADHSHSRPCKSGFGRVSYGTVGIRYFGQTFSFDFRHRNRRGRIASYAGGRLSRDLNSLNAIYAYYQGFKCLSKTRHEDGKPGYSC